MTTLKHLFCLFILISFGLTGKAQVKVECTIENQMVSGTDFFFDIYLKTTPGTSGDLYLDNADFIFTFNHGNFTNPVFSKVSNPNPPLGFIQNGYNTFVSVTNTDPEAVATNNNVQKFYYDNTSTSINSSNELIINLNGAAPTDQTNFDDKVAQIEGTASTFRLGRFKVSGISDATGSAGMTWKGTGAGLRTKIFSLTPSSPFTSTQVATADLTLTNPSDQSLPVEMTSFDAIDIGDVVQVSWETASEINTDYFDVQRSGNSNNWETIARVDAAGTSFTSLKYEHFDRIPFSGNNYYRLKMVDNDETYEYSEIKVVKFEQTYSDESAISIYPNPVSDILNIRFEEATLISELSVFDAKGAKVYSATTDPSNKHKAALNLSILPSGFYTLTVISGHNVVSKKFVKN
ncbi:MAG: T9SS type A sorting domain-containing protein [Bacteroidota bacterium]